MRWIMGNLGMSLIELGFPFVGNGFVLPRKENSIITNGFLLLEFMVPFIINAFFL